MWSRLWRSIAYASNSQMASSLPQIRVACSTMKMSSFPLETEKNIQAMKSYRFLQLRRTQDKKNPWRLPGFGQLSLCTDQPTSLVFFSFLVKFHQDRGIKSRGILYPLSSILYCYSLQQHIFLVFCKDFDTHYRMLAYILLTNKTLLFPKWRHKPTRPILRHSSVVHIEICKIINFENL